MSYQEGRTILVNGGWQAVRLSQSTAADRCGSRTEICNAYQEVDACAGTGQGQCKFKFLDGLGNVLFVVTVGDPELEIDTWWIERDQDSGPADQSEGALVSPGSVPPASAAADIGYDQTWYRAAFWSGEYPDGFTVLKPTAIQLRGEPSPMSSPRIECALNQGATYHPWNYDRVATGDLEFLSFTRIDLMTVDHETRAVLYDEAGKTEFAFDFARGEHWRYLAYLAEGSFLMDYKGKVYIGDQALLENSSGSLAQDEYHAWIRISCANGASGWLFMQDIKGIASLGPANIDGYNQARDIETSDSTQWDGSWTRSRTGGSDVELPTFLSDGPMRALIEDSVDHGTAYEGGDALSLSLRQFRVSTWANRPYVYLAKNAARLLKSTTYTVDRANLGIVSGYEDYEKHQIYYGICRPSNGELHCLEMFWLSSEQDVISPIVTRVVQSFRRPPG
jgi:hypothetical protein